VNGEASGEVEMRRTFESAGLTAPPVPAPLSPLVRKRGDWTFATCEVDPMAMYMFRESLVAMATMTPDAADFLGVCHAGHGVNSYGINYQLRYGPIAIYTQTGWGGVYMDAQESAASVRRMFARCARLIEAAEAARPRFEGSTRCLFVAESSFRRLSTCYWLDRPPPRHEQPPEGQSALTLATRMLTET